MQKKMLKNNIKPIGYNKILGNEIGKNTDHENFGVFFLQECHVVVKLIYFLIVRDIILHIWKSSSAVFHGYDTVTVN